MKTALDHAAASFALRCFGEQQWGCSGRVGDNLDIQAAVLLGDLLMPAFVGEAAGHETC